MATPKATGTEFQINTYSSGNQQEAKIAALSDGGFVVTWVSYGQDGAGSNIHAQRYDSTGAAVGGEYQVNTNVATAPWQTQPSVTELGDGGFVIAWQSYQQDGSFTGVYAQRYDNAGVATGGEFRVNTTTEDGQWDPSIDSLVDGGFVVTWNSFSQDGSFGGIAGQRYDAAGQAVGGEFQVNTYTALNQMGSEVKALPDGGFVVVWNSWLQDGSRFGAYGQRFDATGAPAGAEFQINTTTAEDQGFPSVTGFPDGGFVVTWSSWLQDGSGSGIYGQLYDATGAPTGGEFQINTSVEGRQGLTSVTTLSDGGFVVTWSDEEGFYADISDPLDISNSIFNIYGQRFDAVGEPVGGEFVVNSYTQGDQKISAVAALANGDFVVTWESTGQDDASGTGVFGQVFSINQKLKGTRNDDILVGGSGNDNLRGGQGGDVLDGGAGRDMANYARSAAAVSVDLAAGTGTGGDAQGDTLVSIEKLAGSGFADTLAGDAGRNVLIGRAGDDSLSGGAGNDRLLGGQGADVLDGGTGRDMADYTRSAAAVSVNLKAGTASGGDAQGDTLVSIERLAGSGFDDVLVGNGRKNVLIGNDGDDRLAGRAGDDLLTGGNGSDTFVFAVNTGADTVSDYQTGTDVLRLDDALWGGTGLTRSEVVTQFASVIGGDVVFDFGGSDTVTLSGLTSTAGLADDLMIF